MGFEIWCLVLEFWGPGLGCGVWSSGFGFWGMGLRVDVKDMGTVADLEDATGYGHGC